MRKYLSLLIVIILSMGLLFNAAEAKRFGGGRSFGIQRSTSSFSRTHQPSNNYINKGNGITNNRWFGAIAGLITGGLLASLFMGHGIGSGIITWLVLGALVLFVINFLKNRQQPSYVNNTNDHNYLSGQEYQPRGTYNENPFQRANSSNPNYPPDFNAENFIRDAKVQFIRLQAAYDQKNLADIRQFTTPEVYAEIQMQFGERGSQANHTEVVQLNAELLDVANENSAVLATVKFTGSIKEDLNAAATMLSEIWHFQQDPYAKNWVVAGIQQD